MGASGTHNDGRVEWGNITLSDPDVVMGLLKYRTVFDKLHNREEVGFMESGLDLKDCKEEIMITYIDLDELIIESNLDEYRELALDLFVEGYTYLEIENKLLEYKVSKGICSDYNENVTSHRGVAIKLIENICKTLSEINDKKWELSLCKDLNRATRVCKVCGKIFPETRKYFNFNKKNGKEYINKTCIKCHNKEVYRKRKEKKEKENKK